MAIRESFRGGWLQRFHLLLRFLGLTGLLVAAIGLALVVAEADWSTLESVRTSVGSRLWKALWEPGDDVALVLARFLLPIGVALAVVALAVEVWVAMQLVAGRRSAF